MVFEVGAGQQGYEKQGMAPASDYKRFYGTASNCNGTWKKPARLRDAPSQRAESSERTQPAEAAPICGRRLMAQQHQHAVNFANPGPPTAARLASLSAEGWLQVVTDGWLATVVPMLVQKNAGAQLGRIRMRDISFLLLGSAIMDMADEL